MVVERMEQRHVQDRAHAAARILAEAHRLPADRVVVGLRPAVSARHNLHAVGAKHMQLAHSAVDRDGLEISVPGDEQMPVPSLEQIRRAVRRVGLGEQRQQWVLVDLGLAVEQEQRHACRRFRDHAHRAVDHGVLGEAFARKAREIAWRPYRLAAGSPGDQLRRAARLGFEPEEPCQSLAKCRRHHSPRNRVSAGRGHLLSPPP